MNHDDAAAFFDALEACHAEERRVESKYLAKLEAGEADFFKSFERVVYRCPKRCLLLLVWDAPEGTLVYRPAYTLSRRLNADTSTAEGRAANTADGERRWKASISPYDSLKRMAGGDVGNGFTAGISLECRHAHTFVSASKIVEAVEGSRRGHAKRLMV